MHPDHLGSTSLITDAQGSPVETTHYSPYGLILSGGETSRYSYEGQEYDNLIEQYDFHFRGYKAEWGIFTQPDSLIQDVYDPQRLNRYGFERRNPYNEVDPTGHLTPFDMVILGVGIFSAAAYTLLYISQGVDHDAEYHPPLGGNTEDNKQVNPDGSVADDNPSVINANIAIEVNIDIISFESPNPDDFSIDIEVEDDGTSILPEDIKNKQDEELNRLMSEIGNAEQKENGGHASITARHTKVPAGCTKYCTAICNQDGICPVSCYTVCA